jgi:threonine dehydratase
MTTKNQPQLDVPQLVLDAHERCQEHLSPTPLEYSRYLSEKIEGEVWLKLDSMQRTGSFKFRGAVNKILSLNEAELDKGIVSVSTGNYALAIAEAMRIRKRRATIYVAEDIDPSIRLLFEQHRLVVEGSGALSVGGLLKRKEHFKGKKVVAVICGRNIPLELFKRIIA